MRRTLLPDLLLDARGARSNVAVTVESGRVVEVGPATGGERLPGRALAPGFVNAHSHAFQRALRGRVERRDPHHPEDGSKPAIGSSGFDHAEDHRPITE